MYFSLHSCESSRGFIRVNVTQTPVRRPMLAIWQATKRTVGTIQKAVQVYNFIQKHRQMAEVPANQEEYARLMQIAKPSEAQKLCMQQLNLRCRERLIRCGGLLAFSLVGSASHLTQHKR